MLHAMFVDACGDDGAGRRSTRCCKMQENGDIFEALKTMSAYFLRADSHSICECIQAFRLNDLLFSIVRLERLFARSQSKSSVFNQQPNAGQQTHVSLCKELLGPYHR